MIQRNVRRLFEPMPPKYHHRDPSQSEVIAHICSTLATKPDDAERVFHRLRKARVLVFTMPARTWQGLAYVPQLDAEEFKAHVLTKVARLESEAKVTRNALAALQEVVTSLADANNRTVRAIKSLQTPVG